MKIHAENGPILVDALRTFIKLQQNQAGLSRRGGYVEAEAIHQGLADQGARILRDIIEEANNG